jgi:hypothetical protein
VAVAVTGSPARTAAAPGAPGNPGSPGYSWYRSMMGRYYGGTMMGGTSYQWMMGASGYQWMMGGAGAPGWMHGGSLPATMMGTSIDPGKIMSRLWAGAPGPRVSPGEAARLGNETPAGAQVNRVTRTVTFTTTSVRLTVLGSPAGGPDETFRIAGMVNPTITVPAGAHVSIKVIDADRGTAHGLVVTGGGARSSWMPMMTASPAFSGSALCSSATHRRRDAHRDPDIHHEHAGHLPLPVRGAWPRTERHDRRFHRQPRA